MPGHIACAIHGAIEAAKFPDGELDHGFDRLFIGDVGNDEFRDSTTGVDGSRHAPAPDLIPIREHHLGALF